MISLLVLACVAYACGYLVMIYHWHGGLSRLIVALPSLFISWIVVMLWLLLLFSGCFSCSFGYGLSY